MNRPVNALKRPISDLIARLQALPPGTTYEEVEGEFWGGQTNLVDEKVGVYGFLGTSYQMRINVVNGYEEF